MKITRLSRKGEIIIPQGIREAHHWDAGLEFIVTDTEQGILLTPIKPFKLTTTTNLLGCTGYKGKKKNLKTMQQGIVKATKKQT